MQREEVLSQGKVLRSMQPHNILFLVHFMVNDLFFRLRTLHAIFPIFERKNPKSDFSIQNLSVWISEKNRNKQRICLQFFSVKGFVPYKVNGPQLYRI